MPRRNRKVAFFPHKANLNDTTQAASHQYVAEVGMDLRTVGHMLGMSLERDGRQDNQDGRHHRSLAISAQQNTHKTSNPPDNAHGCVLIVSVVPRLAPSTGRAENFLELYSGHFHPIELTCVL